MRPLAAIAAFVMVVACRTSGQGVGRDAGAADPGTCATDQDCADRGPCFATRCIEEFCLARPEPEGEPCEEGVCDGRGRCVACNDHADCPSRHCVEHACVAARCDDGLADGTESDVDCGGECARRCGPLDACSVGADCAGGACALGACAPTCTDGYASAALGESDVDCGGSCGASCLVGASCSASTDCMSGLCTGTSCAALPSCSDGSPSPGETAIDCGGPVCAPCGDDAACLVAGDCASRVCTAGLCVAASCTDDVTNGDESDLDCGGPCPDACVVGAQCVVGQDCTTGACALDEGVLRCAAASCTDQVWNGQEGATDCGGPCPLRCGPGSTCALDADCAGMACDGATQTCTPNCADGVKTGDETDPDCGGSVCAARCPFGGHCVVDADCVTSFCDRTLHCAP